MIDVTNLTLVAESLMLCDVFRYVSKQKCCNIKKTHQSKAGLTSDSFKIPEYLRNAECGDRSWARDKWAASESPVITGDPGEMPPFA